MSEKTIVAYYYVEKDFLQMPPTKCSYFFKTLF